MTDLRSAVAMHDNPAVTVPLEGDILTLPTWERLNAAGYGKKRGKGGPVACLGATVLTLSSIY